MEPAGVPADKDELARLRDENEQLHGALESGLDANRRVIDERDRLLQRVTALAHKLRGVDAAQARAAGDAAAEQLIAASMDAKHSRTEEELRVAFEDLQALTGELEIANMSLYQAKLDLEERVTARTRELTETNIALRQTELRLSTLVNGIPQLVWRSGNEGQWTWAGEQWCAFTGQSEPESRGMGWIEAFHPDDRNGVQAAWSTAEARGSFEFEGRVRDARDGRYRQFQTRASPVRGRDGNIVEWLGTCTDVDDTYHLREQLSLLISELQHRTRNLMSVVQAVVMRTLRSSRSLEAFSEAIGNRLDALARVQGLLSRRGTQRVAFDTLLREELGAYVELDRHGNSAQVTIQGPGGVALVSSLVQTFALALHELTTNAVKYGALSRPGGHLHVQWQVERNAQGGDRLRVDWRETGVTDIPPEGAGPRGSGYGRELIERALPYQLGALTKYCFTDDGVHCMIEVDVSEDAERLERTGDGA